MGIEFTDIQAPEAGRAPAAGGGLQFDEVTPPAALPAQPAQPTPSPSGVSPDAMKSNLSFDEIQPPPGKGDWTKWFDVLGSAEPDKVFNSGWNAIKRAAYGIVNVLEPVTLPLRWAAAGTVKGLENTVQPGIEKATNPEGKAFIGLKGQYPFVTAPDTTFTDVSLYESDRYHGGGQYQQLEDLILKKGYSAADAAKLVGVYRAIPAYIAGTVADFFLDPLRLSKFGQATKATRAALEAGEIPASIERNLVEIRAPFSNPESATTASFEIGRNNLVGKGLDKAGDLAQRAFKNMDWRTYDVELDAGAATLSGAKRGMVVQRNNQFWGPYMQRNLTDFEDGLVTRVTEQVPNLRPAGVESVPKSITAKVMSEPDSLSEAVGTAAISESRMMAVNGVLDKFSPDQLEKFKSNVGPDIYEKLLNKEADYHEVSRAMEAIGKVDARKVYELDASVKYANARVRPGRFYSEKEVTMPNPALARLGVDETGVRASAMAKLEQIAKDGGHTISPERAQAIVDQVVDNKRMASLALENRAKAGKIDFKDPELGSKLIDNYLTHKPNPAVVKGMRKYDEVAGILDTEDTLTKEADNSFRAAGLSKFDPGGYRRSIRTDLEGANKQVAQNFRERLAEKGYTADQIEKIVKKTGAETLFVQNSTIASLMRLHESDGLVLNKGFLGLLEKKGVKLSEQVLENGQVVRKFYATAPEAKPYVDKVSYWFIPREHGSVAGYIHQYNRVFRSTVLLRPDYYLQNYYDGMLKNYVQGVQIEDYVKMSKVFSGQGTVKIQGETVPAKQVLADMESKGVFSHGSMAEIFDQSMRMAKKMAADGMPVKGQNSVQQLYHWVQKVGGHGEDWLRGAMYLNRIEKGYAPQMAMLDIEKFHFDFSRTTRGIDQFRLFMPFFQATGKTLMIAPEMLGKNPAAFNYFQIQMMNSIERAFNDPTETEALYEMLPSWRKFQDPIMGPRLGDLLGGNSWIYAMMKNSRQAQQGLPQDQVFFKFPAGFDILNPVMAWEQQVMKQGVVSGPLPSALATLFLGLDPFTGKSVDVSRDSISLANRFKEAGKSMLLTGLGMPNTIKMIQQHLRLTDPEYFTPDALLMLNGAFGKFGGVENVDRDFILRMKMLDAGRKQLYKDLIGSVMAEQQGRSTALMVAGSPVGEAFSQKFEAKTSLDIFNAMIRSQQEMGTKVAARDYVLTKNSKNLVEMINGLNAQVKQLNENYVAVRRSILEAKRRGLTDDQLVKQDIDGEDLDK